MFILYTELFIDLWNCTLASLQFSMVRFTQRSIIDFFTHSTRLSKMKLSRDFITLNQDLLILFISHSNIAIWDGTFNHTWYDITLWYLQSRFVYRKTRQIDTKAFASPIRLSILQGVWIIYQFRSPIQTKIVRLTIQSTSIYPLKRLWHPYRTAQNGIVVRRILSQLDPGFMSPDNRKYDEETRAQSAERHANAYCENRSISACTFNSRNEAR